MIPQGLIHFGLAWYAVSPPTSAATSSASSTARSSSSIVQVSSDDVGSVVEIGEDEDNESEGEKSGDENAAGNGNNKTRKRQRLRDGECWWWWWCLKSFVVKGFVVAVVEALIADVCNELHEQEQLSDRFDKVEINGETPGEKNVNLISLIINH